MNKKQQVVTGILAMVIVSSIALMPVNADMRKARASAAPASDTMVATLNTAELAQDQVKDLTYN